MCNPPSEKERGICPCGIKRIKLKGCVVNEVASVVKHHDDHDDSTQEVDRIDTCLYRLAVLRWLIPCVVNVWKFGTERIGRNACGHSQTPERDFRDCAGLLRSEARRRSHECACQPGSTVMC